jgi:hypothetical protein
MDFRHPQVEAEAVLRGVGVLIDYPGGDYDVFRPWSERNRTDFGDRLGFVRLALRTQVPVVPAVSVGAHETLVVLSRGTHIAKDLGLDRLFRIKVMPLVLGPSFGIVPGGIPTWPLPVEDHGRARHRDRLAVPLRSRGRRGRRRRPCVLRGGDRDDAVNPRPTRGRTAPSDPRMSRPCGVVVGP